MPSGSRNKLIKTRSRNIDKIFTNDLLVIFYMMRLGDPNEGSINLYLLCKRELTDSVSGGHRQTRDILHDDHDRTVNSAMNKEKMIRLPIFLKVCKPANCQVTQMVPPAPTLIPEYNNTALR